MRYLKLIILFFLKFKWLDFLYNFFLFKIQKVGYTHFPNINGRIQLISNGVVKMGGGLQMNSGKRFNPIGGDRVLSIVVPNKNAILKIGVNVGISNSTIVCHNSIVIEDNVLIGGSCKIYDTDFHTKNPCDRLDAFTKGIIDTNAKTAPVIIKKGAWIGGHTIVLKGVIIGANSIIGAGSVVSKSIPDNEIWAGNPIKFIKKI